MSLRNMMDSQKDRIRQKICSAISEIWRKETGSLLPLSVEGTVCITPCPGRTTAFQFSSQVPGKFPFIDETFSDSFEIAAKRRKVNEFGEWCSGADVSSDGEEQRQSKLSSVCDSNNNHSEMMDAEIQPVDSEGPSPNDGSNETSDQEFESSDAELSADSMECSNNANGKETEAQDNGMNNDSGVHDMSAVEQSDGGSNQAGVKSIDLVQSNESQEKLESIGKETDENRSTPPPLVIDLSARETTRPVISLMYNSTNVQTAIHNMLSSKLVASSVCKISDGKAGDDTLRLTPTTAVCGSTPRFILQKTVRADECIKISTQQTPTFPKHLTPISFVYPIGGKQFVQQPLQSILSIANPAPSGGVSVEPTTKLNIPLNVSLQTANSTSTSSSSVKAEPGIDQLANNLEQKSYKCEYCQKTFLFKSKYQEHLPVHTTERPFECNVCQRTYKYKYDLNVHQRTHQGIPTKSTVCPKCNHRFPTNKLLRVHINEAHKDDENAPKVKSGELQEATSNDSVPVNQETFVESKSTESEMNISTEEIQ